jgi:glycosyltransferase involved in cell wall biosynthesis
VRGGARRQPLSGPAPQRVDAEAQREPGADRIRVLQVITTLAGGAGEHALALAEGLTPARFDARLVFGRGYPLDQRVAERQLPHDTVSWTRGLAPLATARGAAELAALVRRHRPHIVHAHCSLAGVLARLVARSAGVRTLFTVHAFASREHQPGWRRRLFLSVERAMDAFTDHYCVATRTYGERVVELGIGTADKISVIPLGIALPAAPSPAQRSAARRRLGLAPEQRAIAAAGRLELQKGLVYLLRALPRVRAALPAARLLIFGDGPLRGELEREARASGHGDAISFLGWREDWAELLPGVDAFCVPSLWESFCYAALQALAAAVPVVATRCDALPEVLRQGRCAVLVPPADARSLADALIALLPDETWRRELGSAGRRHAEEHFDVQRMLRSHEQLYLRLARAGAEQRAAG